MKNLFIVIACFIALGAKAQSRDELLLEIKTFIRTTVMSKSYDVDKQKLYDAVYVMMKREYPTITEQDIKKGIVTGYSEADLYKETFTSEIVGSKPYHVVFSIKLQRRAIDSNGRYSGWYDENQIPDIYLQKVQHEIYEALYGSLKLPDDLAGKISAYNAKQKKDKKKILAGRDY